MTGWELFSYVVTVALIAVLFFCWGYSLGAKDTRDLALEKTKREESEPVKHPDTAIVISEENTEVVVGHLDSDGFCTCQCGDCEVLEYDENFEPSGLTSCICPECVC